MAAAVKTRVYHSPHRQQQAAATRRRILEATDRLFGERGYPATSMAEIAAAAGVSVKTVYLAFETKSRLLRSLWDLLLKGDQDDAGVADRPWYREVLAESDPRRQLELLVHASCEVKRRIGGVLRVIRTAAPTDADSSELWRLIQSDFYANQRVLIESLHAKGALREDLDITRGTDVLWTLNHPDTWLLLVGERGWSPEAFEQWFGEAARHQLLSGPAARPSTASARRTPGRRRSPPG